MRPNIFDFIAKSIRSRGPVKEAARFFLVDGLQMTLAASLAGCSLSSVSNSVRRYVDFYDELHLMIKTEAFASSDLPRSLSVAEYESEALQTFIAANPYTVPSVVEKLVNSRVANLERIIEKLETDQPLY